MPALTPLLVALLAGLPLRGGDPVARLGAWVARARSAPRAVDVERQSELRGILGELRLARAAGGDTLAQDLGLVALASLEWSSGPVAGAELLASARLGRGELEGALAATRVALSERLALEVLDPARKRPRAERVVAAQLLTGAYVPSTLELLRTATREEDLDLSQAAFEALCGWDDPSVHLMFLEGLTRSAPRTRIAAEHFERTRASLGQAVLDWLAREVARRYLSEDWREAARARALARALDAPHAVPILIEALAQWNRRGDEGQGSRRIQAEVLGELQRLSGRKIGGEPERWSAWWESVRAGRSALAGEGGPEAESTTSASFFGLQAYTDRVVFVVDRSGSMQATLGTEGRTRYQEAIEQLAHFLRRSGADTRFSVALFSRDGWAWRNRLVRASESNLELACQWLAGNPPEGETRLFAGLRAGLALDERGRLDLARCEADTVIVLCDGATTEGPGWVARWLAEENERAQLVFHCVQIGDEGNGTLEALAEGSGGKFVRVRG